MLPPNFRTSSFGNLARTEEFWCWVGLIVPGFGLGGETGSFTWAKRSLIVANLVFTSILVLLLSYNSADRSFSRSLSSSSISARTASFKLRNFSDCSWSVSFHRTYDFSSSFLAATFKVSVNFFQGLRQVAFVTCSRLFLVFVISLIFDLGSGSKDQVLKTSCLR